MEKNTIKTCYFCHVRRITPELSQNTYFINRYNLRNVCPRSNMAYTCHVPYALFLLSSLLNPKDFQTVALILFVSGGTTRTPDYSFNRSLSASTLPLISKGSLSRLNSKHSDDLNKKKEKGKISIPLSPLTRPRKCRFFKV